MAGSEYDIEGIVFIRFALVGRPVLNGLAGKGQRRRRDPHSATLFARDIVAALQRNISFRRQGEPVGEETVEEFLREAIWQTPIEAFVDLVGIDAGPRDKAKREVSKALAEKLAAAFEIVAEPAFYHGRSGTGPLGPNAR